MKATIKEVSLFKKLISLASDMTNNLSESIEKYIYFSIEDDEMIITSGMSGNHLCELRMGVSSSKAGDFAISAKDIAAVVKAFPSDNLILSTANNVLNITAPVLGTRSLPLYSGDSLSEDLLSLKDKGSNFQIENSSSLSSNLRVLSSFCSSSRLLSFEGKEDHLFITGSNDLGYIRCIDLGGKEEFNFSLDPLVVGSCVSQLGDILSVAYEDNVVRFKSNNGSLWFQTHEDKDSEYEDLEQVISVDSSSTLVIDLATLSSALNWQSLGATDLSSTNISIDKNYKLNILGTGSKPSTLPLTKKDNYETVNLNTRSLLKCVSSLSKTDLVDIEQRKIRAGNMTVKITSFVPHDKGGSYISTIMYEQISI